MTHLFAILRIDAEPHSSPRSRGNVFLHRRHVPATACADPTGGARAIRQAAERVRTARPFSIEAVVLLPDHMHMIRTLPDGDSDFSTRWRLIKHWTSRQLGTVGPRPLNPGRTGHDSSSASSCGHPTLWQPRFWEHTVCSEEEFAALCDYIHYNPVKHGHARCPHGCSYSSFQRFVWTQHYAPDWLCACSGKTSRAPKIKIGRDIVEE